MYVYHYYYHSKLLHQGILLSWTARLWRSSKRPTACRAACPMAPAWWAWKAPAQRGLNGGTPNSWMVYNGQSY